MDNLQKELEELQLHTVKDIYEEFNKLHFIVLDYEETCGDQSQCKFEDCIKRLQNVQNAIIQHSIFSPNEEFKEINTEHLTFLLLPFYMGEVFGRMTEFRKKNLEFSKIYLSEYIKLVDHYGLVSDNQRKVFQNIQSSERYDPTREEKIAAFKDQKELEKQLKNLDLIKDEDQRRDAVKTQCGICVFKALDFLKSIQMEVEILNYKEKIQNDEEAKQEYNAILAKPLPELKYWKVPKQESSSKIDLPYMLSQADQEAMCHSCQGKSIEEIKHQKSKEVWRPDISLPSVRLAELGDMYMADMVEMDKYKAEVKMLEEYNKPENYDSDNEEENEGKRIEASQWDDWKDNNEKGAGNRGGKM